MIIGDSTAHGGHAFHPAIIKPPAADNDNGVDNTPIDPSAVQAVVASAITTASLTTSSQFPTDTSSVETEYHEMLFQLETEHSDKELYWIIAQ